MLWLVAFSLLAAPAPIDDGVKFIAHRGGVVDAQHPENTLASLDAALEQRYWMLELDLQRTRDGVIFLQHDPNFSRVYKSLAKVADTDWSVVSGLTSSAGNQHPITFKEAAERCRGNARVMIDVHGDWSGDALGEVEQILAANGLLESSIMIGSGASKAHFKGKARIATDTEGLRRAVAEGEEVSSLYCLFARGTDMEEEAVQYAYSVHVPVVASVNTFHYLLKPKAAGPKADIRRLYDAGVRLFQIDSEYGPLFGTVLQTKFPAIDKAQDWLWRHPASDTNAALRRERLAVIQSLADECPRPAAQRLFLDGAEAEALMEEYGILHALQRASDHAVGEIRRTRVKSGMVVWLMYNMGYVFKTPDACFAVDICLRDARRLAGIVDFLLITHPHPDHYTGGLARELVGLGKPVISSFIEGGMIVKEAGEYRFGPIRVKVDIGDHSPGDPHGRNNMLMYQIDCGDAANGAVVYHSGDGANYEKMTPDKPVDVFIPHVACSGMVVADAVRHVNPKVALISHILELTHPVGGARWSYDYSFNAIKDLPESQARILVWGERWSLPGTELGSVR